MPLKVITNKHSNITERASIQNEQHYKFNYANIYIPCLKAHML